MNRLDKFEEILNSYEQRREKIDKYKRFKERVAKIDKKLLTKETQDTLSALLSDKEQDRLFFAKLGAKNKSDAKNDPKYVENFYAELTRQVHENPETLERWIRTELLQRIDEAENNYE